MDIQQAYRNMPVHPLDRHLLGMEWQVKVYVDRTLPFGLRSAPLLFTATGDALQWVMEQRGVSWVGHYIDDFVTVCDPGSTMCGHHLEIMKSVCQQAGMPTAPDKEEGPTTVLHFLGMELDTNQLVIRLPLEKLEQLKVALAEWRGRKACRKRDLLSLIGILSHACKAVKAGRSFLRRLIDLSTEVKQLNRFVRLNAAAQSDIEWWYQFGADWNGVAMMTAVNRVRPEHEVAMVSDASGSWGYGAVCNRQWFQLKWTGHGKAADYGITAKELIPIVIAAAVWGRNWQGKTVLAKCDNMAVVAIVNSGTSKEKESMHLRRCLAFLEAKWGFHLFAEHIKGSDNRVADALSRDNVSLVRCIYPQVDVDPVPVPAAVLDVLIVVKPD